MKKKNYNSLIVERKPNDHTSGTCGGGHGDSSIGSRRGRQVVTVVNQGHGGAAEICKQLALAITHIIFQDNALSTKADEI